MSFSVVLDWPPAALSPNSRKCWQEKARVGKYYKANCFYLCKAAKLSNPGGQKLHLSVFFYPPSRHVMDPDNCIASIKFLYDGLAEYLKMNDRDFIPTYHYPEFQKDFKGKVLIKLQPEPDF